MTDLIFYLLAAFVSSIATGMFLWRSRSWSDDDHYALVEKYAEATSALTAMKVELDKLQEQLEFSEDVRYTLGTNNAKLVQQIEVYEETIGELKRDAEKGEEVRRLTVGMLGNEVDARIAFGNRLMDVQRSLRIARHKEFKRWKKARKKECAGSFPPLRHSDNLSKTILFFEWVMADRIRRFLPYKGRDHAAEEIAYGKERLRETIAKLRTMDPYPLP
jgi:uncharacterized protein with von Willebrand factor type A (vWA) domain